MKSNFISRDIYLVKVAPYINKNLIKVIVGQRRTGKSFLLYQIMETIRRDIPEMPVIYINKEDLQFDNLHTYSDLVQYAEQQRTGNAKHAIFIDEIQDIEQFEKALRHFQTNDEWDIYCTGSNANLLSGELATYLSGRYIEIRVYVLSYSEFLLFHNLSDNPENFAKYLKFGGMPYLNQLPLTDNVVFEYLKNIYNTILFKDVVARFNIRHISFLERLTKYVADNIGNLLTAKKINDYLKSQNLSFSNNIVLDYLHHLQNAFMVFCISRIDLKGKRILEIGEKFYFHDTGMRHAIQGYKPNDIAQLFENTVLIHLLINGYEVTIGKWGDKEIDFVCLKNNRQLYIQVTLSLADSKVLEREIGNLLEINDNHRKIVVTGDEYTEESSEGIEIWNIRKFLTVFFTEQ